MADTQDAGQPAPPVVPGEPHPPPTRLSLLSLPNEVLAPIFQFVMDYEERDRGPLRKRTSESMKDVANLALVCRRFCHVIRTVLYEHIEFPRRAITWLFKHGPLFRRMTMLLNSFTSNAALSGKVRAITAGPVGRAAAYIEAEEYIIVLKEILVHVHGTGKLARARITLPSCRYPDTTKPFRIPPRILGEPLSISPSLVHLTHLVVEGAADARSVPDSYVPQTLLNDVISWAPNIKTLVLRRVSHEAKWNLTIGRRLHNLTVLEVEDRDDDASDETFSEPGLPRPSHSWFTRGSEMLLPELFRWCAGLRNLRMNPGGPMYQSELIADATDWDSCPESHNYSTENLRSELDDEALQEIFEAISLEPPGGDSLEIPTFSVTRSPGLHLLDVISTYSLSAATLERLHLGDVRGIIDRDDDNLGVHLHPGVVQGIHREDDDLGVPPGPRPPTFMNFRGAGIPQLKFLCIHFTNIFTRHREEGSNRILIRNIFDGLLNMCPQLTYLEVTGLLPRPHWIQKVLVCLDEEARRHSVDQNAPRSPATSHRLTKVTLVTEGGTGKDSLDTKFTCEYYGARFASMGVELALMRRLSFFRRGSLLGYLGWNWD